VNYQVLGYKMSETWQGLITDFATYLLSFSTPTHTHDFNNHVYGYGRLKKALMRSVSGSPKIWFFDGLKLGNGFGIDGDYDF
jgi:hypothetical protein